MNLLINSCLVAFVLVAGLMVLIILMQRPKSEGLGAAFGAGVTENIFGAQTTNVLVKFTTWWREYSSYSRLLYRSFMPPEHSEQRLSS
jgi:protein translocase SecG subunit